MFLRIERKSRSTCSTVTDTSMIVHDASPRCSLSRKPLVHRRVQDSLLGPGVTNICEIIPHQSIVLNLDQHVVLIIDGPFLSSQTCIIVK